MSISLPTSCSSMVPSLVDEPLTSDRDYAISLVAETSAVAASQANAALDAGGAAAPAGRTRGRADRNNRTAGLHMGGRCSRAAPHRRQLMQRLLRHHAIRSQAYTWGQTLPTATAN